MDSTLLQLFTAEEILSRLSEKEKTGALHVFTAKESANLFFRDGLIIGAVKGLVEGEEVVRQVLEWTAPRFVWQVDVEPAAPLAKAMELAFPEFLERRRAAPLISIGGRKISESGSTKSGALPALKSGPLPQVKSGSLPAVAKEDPARKPPSIPLPKFDLPARPAEQARAGTTATKSLSTTSRLLDTGSFRPSSLEDALLQKYPLVLIGVEGETEGRELRLSRVSSLVGRNPACDFTLDHPSISRQHCLLQLTDRGLHVKDLGTTNGTKVNGITLTEGYVSVGDTVSMGKLGFLVERAEGA
jgi:hypothetical protein